MWRNVIWNRKAEALAKTFFYFKQHFDAEEVILQQPRERVDLRYIKICIKFKLNLNLFYNIYNKLVIFFTINIVMDFIKSWLNMYRSFGITLKHFTKQNSSPCSLHGKIGIQMNNTVYTSKEPMSRCAFLTTSLTSWNKLSTFFLIGQR